MLKITLETVTPNENPEMASAIIAQVGYVINSHLLFLLRFQQYPPIIEVQAPARA
jgi:hypothetical protein